MMESILQLYGLAVVVLPVIGFVSLRKRIRHGVLSKRSAVLRYIGILLVPVLAYGSLFALAVAVEALTPLDLVSDETSASSMVGLVAGVLVCIVAMAVFLLGLLFVRVGAQPPAQRTPV